MNTQKEILVLKIKSFGAESHPSFMKGVSALRCVCSADKFGAIYMTDAFKYVVELVDEIKSGVIVDDDLLKTLNKWFRLPAEYNN